MVPRGEALAERGGVAEGEADGERLPEGLREGEPEALALRAALRESLTVQLMVTDTLCVREGGRSVSDGVWLVEALALREAEGVPLVEGLQEGERVGTTLRVTEGESLPEALALGESVAEAETEGECVSRAEADWLAVADTDGVSEGGAGGGMNVALPLVLGVREPLADSEGEGVPEGDTVGDWDTADEGVAVVVAEEEAVEEEETEGEVVAEEEPVEEEEGVAEVEAVEEPVEEEDTDTVTVSEGECVGSGELVEVVVAEEEEVEEEEVEAEVVAEEEEEVLGLALPVLGVSLCADTLKLQALPLPQAAVHATPRK